MRRMEHVKKLDDAFSRFYVNIVCKCGHTRYTTPEFLANLSRWDITFEELKTRLRCSQCQAREPDVFATPEPRPRGSQRR